MQETDKIMAQPLYNPFNTFKFDSKTCFLSGEKLLSADEEIQVFPVWLMQEHQLTEKPFKLLDESISTYKHLKLPCSTATSEQITALEEKVARAFADGYEAVNNLDELSLFQWISKLVYGIVFSEIQAGIKQQVRTGEDMNFSQVLAKKFTNLHYMLQSLIKNVAFDGSLPFSIKVFKVDNPTATFNYRDEINTLVFSLRMNDFGIIACLQDNGANNRYHDEVLKLVANQTLHPIQFEELCGKYFYSAYLFNRLPEYTILTTDDTIYIEPMPLSGMDNRPIFDHFQAKIYGQVLENFWAPWNLTLFEIIKDPENPMTFLCNEDGEFLANDKITLSRG